MDGDPDDRAVKLSVSVRASLHDGMKRRFGARNGNSYLVRTAFKIALAQSSPAIRPSASLIAGAPATHFYDDGAFESLGVIGAIKPVRSFNFGAYLRTLPNLTILHTDLLSFLAMHNHQEDLFERLNNPDFDTTIALPVLETANGLAEPSEKNALAIRTYITLLRQTKTGSAPNFSLLGLHRRFRLLGYRSPSPDTRSMFICSEEIAAFAADGNEALVYDNSGTGYAQLQRLVEQLRIISDDLVFPTERETPSDVSFD